MRESVQTHAATDRLESLQLLDYYDRLLAARNPGGDESTTS